MRQVRAFPVIAFLALACLAARAEKVPESAGQDLRVVVADYSAEQVYTIYVAQGVATRITLGRDETIKESATGFVSDCKAPSEWCIRADKGDNQIWVKPLSKSTLNNLELSTTKRDYSFQFVVVSGAERTRNAMYRVMFRYPLELPNLGAMGIPGVLKFPDLLAAAPAPSTENEAVTPPSRTSTYPTPEVRNYKYVKKVGPGSETIAPSVVFDDGRFTYLQFPKAQEVPAVFLVAADGSEIRVTTHAERLSGPAEDQDAQAAPDYLVIHRVAPKIILRLGTAVIELINQGDSTNKGRETINGSTDGRFIRQDKDGQVIPK